MIGSLLPLLLKTFRRGVESRRSGIATCLASSKNVRVPLLLASLCSNLVGRCSFFLLATFYRNISKL